MTTPRGTRLRLCILGVLIAACVAGCGGARARYASHLERGKQFLAAGNLEKAGVEFRNAVQIQPRNPEALNLDGRVAEQRGNLREAMGLYQAAIEADAGYDPARANLGKLLVFAGAGKAALEAVAPGLTAHPDNPDLLAVRAAARHQRKDDLKAQADAERAVQLAPTNENAIAILAALYAAMRDYPKAIALVSGALNQVPSSAELREVLANLYLANAQPDQAQEQMRQIIVLKPHDMSPRSQLAMHLVRAGQPDAAQKVLEDAVADFARFKDATRLNEARLVLVDFIAAQRSREQGEKTLRGFIAQEPDNLDLRFGLGSLLQRTGAPLEAIAAYREVIARDGSGAKGLIARDRIAAIEVTQNHLDRARSLIAEVLQKSPRDDDALILRATLALHDRDATSAIGDLRAVLRDQPNSVPLQRTLARAYQEKGQPALAEEALRAAMKSAPNEPAVRLELAQLLLQTDRGSEAVILLQDAVNRAPDDVATREALIRAYLAQKDYAAARNAAEELKRQQPGSAAGYYFAGLIAGQQRHLEDSQRELESALRLQPNALDVMRSLARVEVARGATDAAIARVQTASAADPANAGLLNLLGELYMQRKDYVRASDVLTRACAVSPKEWQSHRNLALVRVAANDPAGAISEYEMALSLAPAESRLSVELAALYEKHGRVNDAIARYDDLYRSSPQLQQLAANNLAMLLVTYRTDQASLDRARDLTSSFTLSDNSSMLDTAGWVHFKRGEFQDALPVLERAVEHAPDSKVIRYHLAMAELRLGQRDRARSNLESALSGAPDFSGADDARSALARLNARST